MSPVSHRSLFLFCSRVMNELKFPGLPRCVEFGSVFSNMPLLHHSLWLACRKESKLTSRNIVKGQWRYALCRARYSMSVSPVSHQWMTAFWQLPVCLKFVFESYLTEWCNPLTLVLMLVAGGSEAQVTKKHNEDCRKLLRMMGVPVIEVRTNAF